MNKHFMNKHWLLALLFPAALLTSCHNHDSHTDEHDGEKHEEKADKHNDNDIILEPEEAKAAGVATERISPSAFSEVITVSGQIPVSYTHLPNKCAAFPSHRKIACRVGGGDC